MGLPISDPREALNNTRLLSVHYRSACCVVFVPLIQFTRLLSVHYRCWKRLPQPLLYLLNSVVANQKFEKQKMDDAVSRALKDHEKPLKPVFLEPSLPACF